MVDITAFPIPVTGIDALPATGALNLAHAGWFKRVGIDVQVPLSQILALFQTTGIATTGASSAVNFTVTGVFQLGGTAKLSDALGSALRAGNGFEFGHTSTAGFRGMLGAEVAGTPFIALDAEAGATSGTYKTRGNKGTIIKPDNAGGLKIQTLATASADNQTPTDILAINASGVITTPLTTNAAFTSLGIDDNATGERLEISDTGVLVGSSVSAGGYNIARPINDGYVNLAGGTAGAGANLLLIGGTHASLAFDFGLMHGAQNVMYWDDSANTMSFSSNAGAVNNILGVATLTNNVFLPDSRFGQNSSSSPGVGNATAGVCLTTSISYFSSAGQAMAINHTSAGNMVGFYLAGANQGFISGSGVTITYGAFMGSHIGQQSLADIAADLKLLRGSIVQTTDEMSFWLGFEYLDHDDNQVFNESVPAGLKIGDKFDYTYDRTIPEQVTRVDEFEETETEEIDESFTEYEIVDGSAVAAIRKRKKRVPVYDELPVVDKAGKPVMEIVQALDTEGNPAFDVKPALNKRKKPIYDDGVLRMIETPRMVEQQQIIRVPRRVTVKQERIEHLQTVVQETVKATIIAMPNDTLVKWKLTSEAGCERPYGVIAWKDHDGSEDWLISGLGAYVCRIKKGVAVKGGDLIQSSDVAGCGEPITEKMNLSALEIAKRHVATVTSILPQPIYYGGPLQYSDGSYIVPATIRCG